MAFLLGEPQQESIHREILNFVNSKGLLVVLSSPSGGGKSTLTRELRKVMPQIVYSVSVTTRPPRQGEQNGMDYRFVSEEEFQRMKDADDLLEYAHVHGHWYGTPRSFIDRSLEQEKQVLLDIDVQGGRRIKEIYPDSVLVFILPPSMSVLESRLRARRLDDDETIAKRLRAAEQELEAARGYDYLVLNEKIGRAVDDLKCIIVAETLKMTRGIHPMVAKGA